MHQISLLHDPHSDDQSSMCVNLKLIITKFKQQRYSKCVQAYMSVIIIHDIGTYSIAVSVDR